MPLLWIAVCLVAGMVLAEVLPGAPAALRWYWLAAAAVVLLGLGLLRRIPAYAGSPAKILRWLSARDARLRLPPLLLLVFVCLGAARAGWHGPEAAANHIAHQNDNGPARLVGVVSADPDRRDQSTLLRVKIERAENGAEGGPPEAAVQGTALVLLPGQSHYAYGDRLLIQGTPVTPPEMEDFSYRDYLARQGVYTYIAYPKIQRLARNAGSPILAAVYRLRQAAYAEIYRLFPAPEAPLLAGILLGLDNDLPPALTRAFQDTGTAHVIAISGFNIAILAGLFSSLFGRLVSRWWAMALSIVAISAYTVFVGASPSVVRAAIMGGMALLAHQIGRRSAGLHTLAVTAAAMCLFNPLLPWDASFQLSFGATLGLIVYGEQFQSGFQRLLERRLPAPTAQKIAGPVGEYVLMTLAAQAMTLPIILYHFQRLSISSLLANPLILPPQPLLMVLSGTAVIAGLISDPLGHALAALAWPLSAYTIRMVELLGALPAGAVSLPELHLGTVALMYLLVLAPLLGKRFPLPYQDFVKPGLLLSVTGLLAAVLWRGAQAVPDGQLHLTVFDMDGSQAVLVVAPGGESLLINGGPSGRLLNDALGRRLSPFHRQLDAVLINNPEASTFGGLTTALEIYPARAAYWGCEIPTSRAADRFVEALSGQNVPQYRLAAGQTLRLGEVQIRAAIQHEQGSTLLLTWRGFRALLPGESKPSHLQAAGLRHATILVLQSRHWEDTTGEEWQVLSAQAIVGTLPEGAVLPAARNQIITRRDGWVSVTTDGTRMWIEQD